MNRNWLFVLSLLVAAVAIAQPTPLFGQDDSKNQQEEVIPLDRVTPGITAPRAIYSPEPDYDDASRRAKLSGVVVLSIVVTKEGRTRDVNVIKSLSPGLDKKALEAVSKWKFTPATKDGDPVAVRIKVEVSFKIR